MAGRVPNAGSAGPMAAFPKLPWTATTVLVATFLGFDVIWGKSHGFRFLVGARVFRSNALGLGLRAAGSVDEGLWFKCQPLKTYIQGAGLGDYSFSLGNGPQDWGFAAKAQCIGLAVQNVRFLETSGFGSLS